MNYVEVEFVFSKETRIEDKELFCQILESELCDKGFESFCDTDKGFLAYCQDNLFAKQEMNAVIDEFLSNNPDVKMTFQVRDIEQKDWNNEWEKNYAAVLVDNYCYVRAWFHKENPQAEYNIEITPQMSFGTAHHATTYQIIQLLHTEDVKDKNVMDMGCGTGILAILCKMKGSAYTEAIDIDEWAYKNALDNVRANEVEVNVRQGDAKLLDKMYDLFIANINRNILLEDIATYAQHINRSGVLILSGFYESDVPLLTSEAEKWGFSLTKQVQKDSWVAIRLQKKESR